MTLDGQFALLDVDVADLEGLLDLVRRARVGLGEQGGALARLHGHDLHGGQAAARVLHNDRQGRLLADPLHVRPDGDDGRGGIPEDHERAARQGEQGDDGQ